MTFSKELTKKQFIEMFGYGYYEDWKGYGEDQETKIVELCLKPFFNESKTALEIGCGKGKWTSYLSRGFRNVICLDVIPITFSPDANVTYIELPNEDYHCIGIPDQTIDFVWSFGTFCHFGLPACEVYLESIYKKLCASGEGVITFANWNKNGWEKIPDRFEYMYRPKGNWFYNDDALVYYLLRKSGFQNIKDMMPEFRDTIMYFKKPEL